MEIKFFKPKSEILQQYIEGYYFLTNNKCEPIVEYFTFPNNFSILSVIIDVAISYSENKYVVKQQKSNIFVSDLICHYKKPINLSYAGNVNEITFYFKPLGLNAFLSQPLSDFTGDFFINFLPYDDYEITFKTILKEKCTEKRIELIENYWLSKLIGFQHLFLKDVIAELEDSENDISIGSLAKKHKITRQNLTKHFECNLCKSPSDFKKINRFRAALKSQLDKNKKANLTALTYDMLFYDQSHLIKDFKSLTGLTPKKFFKNISSQADGKMTWLFV